MKRTSYLTSLVGIAALILPMSLLAQDEEAEAEAPAPLSDIWYMVVKPGMESQFNDAMAAHIQFRKEAGESRSWQAYRVAVGHDIRPIQYRSCCFDWADLDTQVAEGEELGLNENFQATVAQYVDHYHHYLERADWANSHWPTTGTSGPYYGVTTWKNKQGRGPESNDAKDSMSQMAKEEGWASDENNWLWFSRIGGDSITSIVSSFENYADMAPPEQSFYEFTVEQIGEEAADELFADFGSGFDDSDYTIWELDESLSTVEDEEEADE